MPEDMPVRRPGLLEVAAVFFKIGVLGFGGPAAHIAMMEEEVVRRRRWLSAQAFIDLVGASHQEVTNWLANPINAALMLSLIVATFYHAALGLQVVYEDYVEPHGLMIAVNVATKLLCFFLAAASVIAVLKIAIGG